jgi:hypothetical protein
MGSAHDVAWVIEMLEHMAAVAQIEILTRRTVVSEQPSHHFEAEALAGHAGEVRVGFDPADLPTAGTKVHERASDPATDVERSPTRPVDIRDRECPVERCHRAAQRVLDVVLRCSATLAVIVALLVEVGCALLVQSR